MYGGIHAIAWNGHFPTLVEQRMWQAAAVLVVAMAAILFGLGALQHIPMVLSASIVTLYATARLYLVVEAFISLRSLPLGAYSTPSWVDTLPHIG